MQTLHQGWSKRLANVFQRATAELFISSPYISETGIAFLLKHSSPAFKAEGRLTFITDLSPKSVYQGSTDPDYFKSLFEEVKDFRLLHLPRLHAKTYISDSSHAIITSGNLTAGGLYNNFEYGVFLDETPVIETIKHEFNAYSTLGAPITRDVIIEYCNAAAEVKTLHAQKEKFASPKLAFHFDNAFREAGDTLIKAHLQGGTLHSVFEKTILYLLEKHGALTTASLYTFIQDIHPDLCDDTVDRVINGINFGKKWKHAVRTAQQNLKKKGRLILKNQSWRVGKT
jgi:HKD family nuclease